MLHDVLNWKRDCLRALSSSSLPTDRMYRHSAYALFVWCSRSKRISLFQLHLIPREIFRIPIQPLRSVFQQFFQVRVLTMLRVGFEAFVLHYQPSTLGPSSALLFPIHGCGLPPGRSGIDPACQRYDSTYRSPVLVHSPLPKLDSSAILYCNPAS